MRDWEQAISNYNKCLRKFNSKKMLQIYIIELFKKIIYVSKFQIMFFM